MPSDKEALDLAQQLLAKVSDSHILRPLMVRVVGVLLQPCRHSVDFASVNWHGQVYSFTATQARIVKSLWRAWRAGTPDVRQETLLDLAGSESGKLSSLFADSPAWGRLIVQGQAKGTFRLAEPAA